MKPFNIVQHVAWLFYAWSSTAAQSIALPGYPCNADNCLRALRADARSADSHQFCSAYIDQTTRTITFFESIDTTIPVTTTTVISDAITIVRTTLVATQTTLVKSVVTVTTTVPVAAHLENRAPVPTPPSYLSKCSGDPKRLSSACACYIGTTAADVTATETSYATIGALSTETVRFGNTFTEFETDTSTTTFTSIEESTTTATVLATATAACNGNTDQLSSVFLRIEGAADTIFEGKVTSGPRDISTPSGGTHHCDGTNNNNEPTVGATCTTALDEASCLAGFPYDGTFSASFDDYFITSIGTSTQTSTQFWELLLNYQFTPVGGCQQKTQPGDRVLWAFDAFNAVHFLEASPSADFTTTVVSGNVGEPVDLYVRDGTTANVIAGAEIGGALTDATGRAIVTFMDSGTFVVKATQSGSIRSNSVKIIIGSN